MSLLRQFSRLSSTLPRTTPFNTHKLLSSSIPLQSQSTTSSPIVLFVNGKRREIDPAQTDPSSCLLDYLRSPSVGLTGSKMACGEGGCGACTVVATRWDQTTQKLEHRALNSCLTGLPSVAGMNITTPEGLATKEGEEVALHPIQKAFVENFGSQCGYCTPGFLMSLYGGIINGKKTPVELEKVIDGNLCRCTGYRPISAAINQLSQELSSSSPPSSPVISLQPEQIEEMKSIASTPATHIGQRTTWYTPTTLKGLLEVKRDHPPARLIGGNSEIMLEQRFLRKPYPVLSTANFVPELQKVKFENDELYIGGAATLTSLDEVLQKVVESHPEESPVSRSAKAIRNQIFWFSGTSVRNGATVAGNVATASPISDLNPVWLSLGAKIEVESLNRGRRIIPASDFFLKKYRQTALQDDELIIAIRSPLSSNPNFFVESFKQSPRREDDIATVTACLSVQLDPTGNHVEEARLAYGGMAPTVVRASQTEEVLKGKKWNEETLQEAMGALEKEFQLPEQVPGGRPEYRSHLCRSFFYKFFWRSNAIRDPNSVPSAIQLGVLATPPPHGIESSLSYDGPPPSKEVGRNLSHASSVRQVTGEAVYVDDLPVKPREVYAGLVLSDRAHAKIKSIDTSASTEIPGFRNFYSHNDVPGDNKIGDIIQDEELFASEKVTSVAQIIGVVTAEDEWAATEAAARIKVEYEDLPAILSIQEAIGEQSFLPEQHTITSGDPEGVLKSLPSNRKVSGNVSIGGQEHFYFEPNGSIATPIDSEMVVDASSQNMNKTQAFVSRVLGLPSHKVQASVRRIGGGFGGKETQTVPFSCAAAVAAHHEQRPVRLIIPRNHDMCGTGKRHPFYGEYELGFDPDTLKIQAVDAKLYSNAGFSHDLSLPVLDRSLFHAENAYEIPDFQVHGAACKTNVMSNTAFRGFGGPQGMFLAETYMEHAAHAIGKPSHLVREANLYTSESKTPYGMTVGNTDMKLLFKECKAQSNFEERLASIEEFNSQNRWKKRGLSLIPSKFGLAFTFTTLNQGSALVHVFTDGSVLVSHGGVEMGQGLHTKVIQIVADALGVPSEQVYISDSNSSKIANASPTAASMGSDLYGMAALKACQELRQRLDEVQGGMGGNPSFKEVVVQAYLDRVNLSAHGFHKVPVSGFDFEKRVGTPFHYFTSGVACTEAELDVLTGDHRVLQSDIVMDVGRSINPMIDIGQIEGAFAQGQGWCTVEELIWGDRHHQWLKPGHFFSNGPGNYKIPSLDDMPRKFNVSLLKGWDGSPAVHSSRGIGEPPLFLGASVLFALRHAVQAARKSNGYGDDWFHFDSPFTPERLYLLSNGVDAPSRGSW